MCKKRLPVVYAFIDDISILGSLHDIPVGAKAEVERVVHTLPASVCFASPGVKTDIDVVSVKVAYGAPV